MDELVNPPKQDRGRETQERILKAFKRLLKKNPFDSISVRQLVQEANTSIGSFYARFRDKDALLPVLYGEYESRLEGQLERLREDVTHADTLDEVAEHTVEHIIGIVGESPNLSRALYQYATRAPKTREAKELAKRRVDQYAFLMDALLAFKEEMTHPDPPRAVELAFYFVVLTCRNRIHYPLAPQTRTLKISIDELRSEMINLLTGYLRNQKVVS